MPCDIGVAIANVTSYGRETIMSQGDIT